MRSRGGWWGWRTSDRADTELVLGALCAGWNRNVERERLVVHCDHGAQPGFRFTQCHILSMLGEAQWVHNLRAAGAAQLRVGRQLEPVVARELRGQAKAAFLTWYCQHPACRLTPELCWGRHHEPDTGGGRPAGQGQAQLS